MSDFIYEISLADAVEFIVDNRGRTAPTDEHGIPLIATNCVSNENLYPSKEKLRYVSQETYENWFRSHPIPGDILLTNKGSQNGAVCLVPDPVDFCIAQDMVALRADPNKIYPLYLFAVLRSNLVQNRIKELNVDAVIPHFKKTDFNKLYFPLPSEEEQKFIGDLYLLLSYKIELNRKINQTLESIAQAIFKSWFVDFEPVKAKIAAIEAGEDAEGVTCAAMRAISGKTDYELDQMQAGQPDHYAQLKTTVELFPAAMQDSELGEVPDGWEVSTIGEEVGVVGGGTPSTKNLEFWKGGEIHWTTPKDLSNISDKVLLTTDRKITETGLKKISSGLLPVDTVLMSSRAPVGYLALAKVPVAVNQGYIAMLCDKRLSPEFVIQWCNSVMDEIKQRSSGTTFAEISKKNFKVIPLVVPSEGIQQSYSELLSGIYNKIAKTATECKTLADIRDSLLPKLISGEVIPYGGV